MNREGIIQFLIERPVEFARMIGFDKLTEIHNGWIQEMITGRSDYTLQAHRGSYKTTCVSISLALIILLFPDRKTLFMRKTDNDIKEVVRQVRKILMDSHTLFFVDQLYGRELRLVVESATEVSTNLSGSIKGTSQLVGIGTGASLTGKHFDYIFTDDIINVNDRVSKAERDRTKLIYQELQNIKNRGGKIFNTLTPWHPDSAESLMPNVHYHDCYSTGLIAPETIEYLKLHMSQSLFAANYELRHIADENMLFADPRVGADAETIRNGIAHVDAAFYGEDYTAFSIIQRHDGKYYLFGKIWRKHVQDCYGEILSMYVEHGCGRLYLERNSDKGMVARDLRELGIRTVSYDEGMNKHIKIATYLKAIWPEMQFVEGTDEKYIDQICNYTEDAEHDDAPDSAACLARLMYRKRDNSGYVSIIG